MIRYNRSRRLNENRVFDRDDRPIEVGSELTYVTNRRPDDFDNNVPRYGDNLVVKYIDKDTRAKPSIALLCVNTEDNSWQIIYPMYDEVYQD